MELALQPTAETMRLLRATCHPEWRTCRIAIRDRRKSLSRIQPTARRESARERASQRAPGSPGHDDPVSPPTRAGDPPRLRLAMGVEARARCESLLELLT